MNAMIWLAVLGWSVAALATVCAVEANGRLRRSQIEAAFQRARAADLEYRMKWLKY